VIARNGVSVARLTALQPVVRREPGLWRHHRDPTERMLIATALRLDLAIITNDTVFPAYGVRTVW
jgi:PIN domain nuclease of toxin-antitoxin system